MTTIKIAFNKAKSISPLGEVQKTMTTYDYKNHLVYSILQTLRQKAWTKNEVFYEGTVFILKDKSVNSLKSIAKYHNIDI